MCRTMFFEIPYTNKLWICFVDFHFCIFSCKRSIEKEYSYIIWKCFFFMGGTEWRDYFNTGAWNHHCDVYIRPVGTTTYLLWRIYTSRGIQRVKGVCFYWWLLVWAKEKYLPKKYPKSWKPGLNEISKNFLAGMQALVKFL